MKTRLCPHCQRPLMYGSVWEFIRQSEYLCSSCGKSSRLSMFGLNFILFIFIALSILAGNRLGYTTATLAIGVTGAILYLVATAFWIPLIPASPVYTHRDRKHYKWYQAPVLWIAVFVVLLVWAWQTLGLS